MNRAVVGDLYSEEQGSAIFAVNSAVVSEQWSVHWSVVGAVHFIW